MNRIGVEEIINLEEVLQHAFSSSWTGTMVRRFEKAFARRMGRAHAVAMSNGTVTLQAILSAAGLRAGDEVIVPPLTMASTSLAVLHAGCTPVWADVDPKTWTLDPESVLSRLTERTKAIMVVALYGVRPDMDALAAIAAERKLLLIEDNAQTMDAPHHGTDAAGYSLQSSKIITCGEGGVVVCDDDEYAERLRSVACLGYRMGVKKAELQRPDHRRHHLLGWNHRMSDLQAAVALSQLERVDDLVASRAVNAAVIRRVCKGWLDMPDGQLWAVAGALPHGVDWHQWVGRVVLEGGERPYACWLPTYREPVFQGLPHHDCPVAEGLQPRIVAFQTNQRTRGESERTAEAIRKAVAAGPYPTGGMTT